MAQILFGFGGCKFAQTFGGNDITATFDGGIGRITFSPIQLQEENIDHNIVSRLLGYRVTLDIDELFNIDSDDNEEYQELAIMLSNMVSGDGQRTIRIYPRYDSELANNLSYECILTSDFSPEDLHRLKIGQKLKLKFACINKKTSIPTMVSDTEWDNLMFNNDNAIFKNLNDDNIIVQIY